MACYLNKRRLEDRDTNTVEASLCFQEVINSIASYSIVILMVAAARLSIRHSQCYESLICEEVGYKRASINIMLQTSSVMILTTRLAF